MDLLSRRSETYEDLPLTNFPVSEDTFERMMDVTIAMYPLVKQYNEYYEAGNLTKCNELLDNNPNLKQAFFNANSWNMIRDAIIALERFFLEDVETFINNVAQNSIGINDNPSNDHAATVSYSAEKVNQLFSDNNQKYHTLRNITIPASGWSSEFPYTNTVSVDGITPNVDLKVIGVYVPEGATVDNIKAWNKAAGFLIESEDATADGTITFKAYKKPTVDFTVITEGG